MLLVGDDWAEAHHDIEIEDELGRRLARGRLPEGLAGISRFHELVADHLDPDSEPSEVPVGIETDRGPWVQALVAAGYSVYAINPFQVSRYRDRHAASGAKGVAGPPGHTTGPARPPSNIDCEFHASTAEAEQWRRPK